MLPNNFDFAQIPAGTELNLREIGMLSSTIEDIDAAVLDWMKQDLELHATTNEGWKKVPVFWQTPERSFQVKNNKELRDDAGSIILPVLSLERTGITKDPNRKGGFQANLYSKDKNGRTGRMVIAKKIVKDAAALLASPMPKSSDTCEYCNLVAKRKDEHKVIKDDLFA